MADLWDLRRLPGFLVLSPEKEVQGQVSASPLAEALYSHHHKDAICVK